MSRSTESQTAATAHQASVHTASQGKKQGPRLKKFAAYWALWNLRYNLPTTSLFSCALPAFLIRQAFNLEFWRREKLRRRPIWSTQECARDELCKSVRRCGYELRAARHRDKWAVADRFFCAPSDTRVSFF